MKQREIQISMMRRKAKETDARWQAFPAPSPASRQTSPVTEVGSEFQSEAWSVLFWTDAGSLPCRFDHAILLCNTAVHTSIFASPLHFTPSLVARCRLAFQVPGVSWFSSW